jgi:hypothetical protein
VLLAGDRNITNGFPVTNAIISLRTNENVRWTQGLHYPKGNVTLGDGSVLQIESDTKLREFLSRTGDASNRVALPLVD